MNIERRSYNNVINFRVDEPTSGDTITDEPTSGDTITDEPSGDTKSKGVFYGYALKFATPSPDYGFIEVIDNKALDQEILNKSDIRALFNHDPNLVLARNAFGQGTLRLSLDNVGLYYEFDDPDTTLSRDLKRNMELGNITQSSFAFILEEDSITEIDGKIIRTILKIKEMFDISPVTYPFYPTATSGVRQRVEDYKKSLEQKDTIITQTDLSRSNDISKFLRIEKLRY